MDLGISDLARPSTDYVKHGFMVYVDRSDYEGVGVMEYILGMLIGALIIVTWLVVGGEGDDDV